MERVRTQFLRRKTLALVADNVKNTSAGLLMQVRDRLTVMATRKVGQHCKTFFQL